MSYTEAKKTRYTISLILFPFYCGRSGHFEWEALFLLAIKSEWAVLIGVPFDFIIVGSFHGYLPAHMLQVFMSSLDASAPPALRLQSFKTSVLLCHFPLFCSHPCAVPQPFRCIPMQTPRELADYVVLCYTLCYTSTLLDT